MSEAQTELLFDPATGKAVTKKLVNDKRTFDRPLAHRADPLSSYQAGDTALRSGRISGQMRFTFDALKVYPDSTSAELAKFAMLDRYNVARRLPALARRGLVERGPIRMCSVCGCLCVTWRAAL